MTFIESQLVYLSVSQDLFMYYFSDRCGTIRLENPLTEMLTVLLERAARLLLLHSMRFMFLSLQFLPQLQKKNFSKCVFVLGGKKVNKFEC